IFVAVRGVDQKTIKDVDGVCRLPFAAERKFSSRTGYNPFSSWHFVAWSGVQLIRKSTIYILSNYRSNSDKATERQILMNEMQLNRNGAKFVEILGKREEQILSEWMKEMTGATRRGDLIKDSDLRAECAQFLKLMTQATANAGTDFQSPAFNAMREMLNDVSRSRAQKGFKPSETATFVFSLKPPLFNKIQADQKGDAETMVAEIWSLTELLDAMGLYTMEVFQKSRE